MGRGAVVPENGILRCGKFNCCNSFTVFLELLLYSFEGCTRTAFVVKEIVGPAQVGNAKCGLCCAIAYSSMIHFGASIARCCKVRWQVNHKFNS